MSTCHPELILLVEIRLNIVKMSVSVQVYVLLIQIIIDLRMNGRGFACTHAGLLISCQDQLVP